MPSKPRKRIPVQIEANVLLKSRRRCCICFGLHLDVGVKLGQISHLDRNRSNYAENNLAFLCLDHHTTYDSRTSQHKNFTIEEVKAYQLALHTNLLLVDQVAAAQRAFVAMSHYPPGLHGWAPETSKVIYVCTDVEV